MPTCWIVAGPNGAGKTTFALNYLPHIAGNTHFINADLIAAGLSPFAPERKTFSASRLLLKQIEEYIADRSNFAFETTLAGQTYLRLIDRLRADRWQVELIYLALPDVDMSIKRVAERVSHGGHHIPIKDIKRRFPRSLKLLLSTYSNLVDQCTCYMNDGVTPEFVFVQNGDDRYIVDNRNYQILEELSK